MTETVNAAAPWRAGCWNTRYRPTCASPRTTPDGSATLRLHRRPDGTGGRRRLGPRRGLGPGRACRTCSAPGTAGRTSWPTTRWSPTCSGAGRGCGWARAGRVWDVLLPAVLEQKVTGVEAHRSWRELCWRFGEPAPGPAPAGMRVPPTPAMIRTVPDWEWHRAGVDHARRRTILAAATVAHRLEAACGLGGEPGRELLRRVPGIGVWTAAEVAQRAWGDPDAVSFGDLHIPTLVGWALVGRPLDDAGMLAVLAPYRPQRHRAVRYVEVSGFRRPRFAPRFAPKDYRAL